MQTWQWIAGLALILVLAGLNVRVVRRARELLTLRQARRAVVFVVGTTLVLSGVVLLFIPGPGLPLIFVALGLLAAEFAWAKRLLERVRRMVRDAGERIQGGARGRASETEPDEVPDVETGRAGRADEGRDSA